MIPKLPDKIFTVPEGDESVKDSVEESIYKLNRRRSTSSFIGGNTKNQDHPLLTLKQSSGYVITSNRQLLFHLQRGERLPGPS
ncbi:hypothetical protein NC651_040024 [Populus alba x Populus x berolinensis]|nr:hypothetical protein NC651_040024 [Populus alba x Populus x berolinensis]